MYWYWYSGTDLLVLIYWYWWYWYTGTDTDAFAYSNGGVPSALISLPLRYMHTTVEMVQKEDVENVIKLIFETLQNIKANESFNYFD